MKTSFGPWFWSAVALNLFVSIPARADTALAPRPLGKVAIKIDGALSEWRGARFVRLGEGDGGALEYTLGYDAQALYLGARVRDDSFVRTRAPSPREDALVISLALPNARGTFEATEVWLFAGIPGSQAATAAVARGGAAPAKSDAIAIVEGPLPKGAGAGYVIEARVPFTALPNGSEFHLGRGAIRLNDVDGKPGAARVIASASGARLPPLLCEGGPNAALDDFLKAKDLDATSVRHDLVGDVAGDGHLERVLVAGTYAAVAGSAGAGAGGSAKGSDFEFIDLPVAMSSAVGTAALRDLTGDGKAELTLRLRQQNDLGARDLFQVLDLSQGQPRVVFAIELRKQTEAGSVEAELTIGRAQGGAAPAFEVRPGEAKGLDASNFAEQLSGDVQPILLPWGPVARRVYRWDGTRFAVIDEEPSRAPKQQRRAEPSAPAPAAATGPAPKVYAKPPGEDELVAAFREQRAIDPAITPRFVQRANVADDGRIESLMLFGKDLLVVGKGYRGGTGYFFYGLPVREPADVLRMFTADVTGDRRRELFVRIRQRLGDVQREILLAYTFDDEGIAELLGTEVRRAQGDKSVGNRVQLVRDDGHFALRIDPGDARGWDARSYPFVAESTDAYGPLLLPWAAASVQYRFDGQRLLPGSAGR